MLPVILGAVALGTVGYGVKKCLSDEECVDNAKDKIQDLLISGYEGLEKIEEKMGLYDEEITFKVGDPIDEILLKQLFGIAALSSQHDVGKEVARYILSQEEKDQQEENKEFLQLYEMKKTIRQKLLEECNITILKNENDIKKDKTNGVTITEAMRTNLSSYAYLLNMAYSKIKYNFDHKTATDIKPYITLLKDLFTTKIIKKGKLNEQSSQLIIDGMHIVLGQKAPIRVDLV